MSTARLFILALVFAAIQVNAATISYSLDLSNDLPDGINYAQVTITDSGDNIDFIVEVNSSAFSDSGKNFGMQSFAFNYDNSLSLGTSNIGNLVPSSWDITSNANAGGNFGKFDFEIQGAGNSRATLLTFSIVDVAGDTILDYALGSDLKPASGEYFAAHIAGFDETGGVTSAKFAGSTPAVPVPAALLLFASGLISLAGFTRHKQTG